MSEEKVVCHSCKRISTWNVPIRKCCRCGQSVCGLCKAVVGNDWVCGIGCVDGYIEWKKDKVIKAKERLYKTFQ